MQAINDNTMGDMVAGCIWLQSSDLLVQIAGTMLS